MVSRGLSRRARGNHGGNRTQREAVIGATAEHAIHPYTLQAKVGSGLTSQQAERIIHRNTTYSILESRNTGERANAKTEIRKHTRGDSRYDIRDLHKQLIISC